MTNEMKVGRAVVVVFSYHHKNTEKLARVFGRELNVPVRAPQDVSPAELQGCDLIGFGSGIDSGRHYAPLLALADALPAGSGKKVFIFSTYGAPTWIFSARGLRKFAAKNHAALRVKLQAKGYEVVDEFACPGHNTNSFLKFFGGLNKGRPDADDLARAAAFIGGLRRRFAGQ